MSGKNKRQALGRGLDALLGDSNLINGLNSPENRASTANSFENKDNFLPRKENKNEGNTNGEDYNVIGAIAAINIDLIEVNPKQPRKHFDENTLNELAESIRHNGIIQPLTVRKHGKIYQLISGERRLRASKIVGLKEVPVYIRMASENELLEMGLIENIQREDLNALDIALSYQALVDVYGYNQEAVSKKVGKERSTITNYLRLLKLPAEVQLALKDNDISMGHARALLSVENPEEQVDWVRKIIQKGHSVRFVEQGVRQKKGNTGQSNQKDTILPDWCRIKSSELSEKIETLVEIKKSKGGKGSLQIKFSSEEELQNILDKLNA